MIGIKKIKFIGDNTDYSYKDYTECLWDEVLPKAIEFGKEYGDDNVRIVMDFDS